MKIAVAGSDGFIGGKVCSLLENNNHEIIRLDISRGIDLCNTNVVDNIPEFECFIHLANLVYVPDSYKDPGRFYRVNYLTTLNALEVCRKYRAHLIYASSYIYGSPHYLPVDENHPICPFNPYAQSKYICEKLCEGYHRDFNVKVTILRPFNIYGIGQKGKLLIPEIVGQLKEGKKQIQLRASTPRRDYIYVDDVARAFITCVFDNRDYGIYNVCTGESVSIKEITEVFNKYLKNKVEFIFKESDRPNEVDETKGNCNKLMEIGWKPTKNFEEGIFDILKFEKLI